MRLINGDGELIVRERKTRLRRAERLEERDRLIYQFHLAGMSVREIGPIFKLGKSVIAERIQNIPESVRLRYRRDAARLKAARLADLADEVAAYG